jgi:hypothetical protein
MDLPVGIPSLRRSMLLALVATLLLTSGCFQVRPWRTQDRPWQADTISNANQVRITRLDGSSLVLKQTSLHTTTGELHGVEFGGSSSETLVFPVDGLASLETRQVEKSRLLGNMALGATYTVVIVMVAIILTAPVVLGG